MAFLSCLSYKRFFQLKSPHVSKAPTRLDFTSSLSSIYTLLLPNCLSYPPYTHILIIYFLFWLNPLYDYGRYRPLFEAHRVPSTTTCTSIERNYSVSEKTSNLFLMLSEVGDCNFILILWTFSTLLWRRVRSRSRSFSFPYFIGMHALTTTTELRTPSPPLPITSTYSAFPLLFFTFSPSQESGLIYTPLLPSSLFP